MHPSSTPLSRSANWLRLFFAPSVDAGTYYDLLGDHVLGGGTLANMGYWRSASDLPAAVAAMFELVRSDAGLGPSAFVVDAGCGFGTNAVECAARGAAREVLGLNLSTHQLTAARRLAHDAGLSDRVRFQQASATSMPLGARTVDTILSVEAAFHFASREAFFAEAARVLKPGGRLSLVDIVAPPPTSLIDRLLLPYARRGLQLPSSNVYGLDDYRARVERAGFDVQRFESIRADVFPPFRRWFFKQPLRRYLEYNAAMMLTSAAYFFYRWDYVKLVAVRR
ncbi:MAG: methyltransferase domain-containing protein [Myxococcaceae bacterium]|nr:methyltransferase domain-containing protein [Myxococcaceae bacterium]